MTVKAPLDAAFVAAKKLTSQSSADEFRSAESNLAQTSLTFGDEVYITRWPASVQPSATALLNALAPAIQAEKAAAAATSAQQLIAAIHTSAQAQTKAAKAEETFRKALGFTN